VAPTTLRQFLYLNDPQVDSYLAQLEGGRYDEEDQTDERTDDATMGGEVNARIAKAQAGRKGLSRSQLQRKMQQTSASRFARLYDLLDEDDGIQELPALDQAIWDQLRRQEVVDVQAIVALPALTRVLGMVPMLEGFAAFAEMMGEPLDAETQKTVEMMQQLSQLGDRQVTIIAAVAGTPKFKFVSHLDREHLQVDDPTELEGEANVIGVIQRKIKKGQTIPLAGPLTGMLDMFPPELRKQAERDFAREMAKEADLGHFGKVSVGYPAAVLNTVAIYR
jgi:hypothetical protein